jgi:hypothetical protein
VSIPSSGGGRPLRCLIQGMDGCLLYVVYLCLVTERRKVGLEEWFGEYLCYLIEWMEVRLRAVCVG